MASAKNISNLNTVQHHKLEMIGTQLSATEHNER